MSKALVEMPWPFEGKLPPMDADVGLPQLHYVVGYRKDGSPIIAGGYSCVGLTGKRDRCVVQVDASPATLAEMRLNPKLYGDCKWLEDVAEAAREGEVAAPAVALAAKDVKAALARCAVRDVEYAGAGGRGHVAANKASWEDEAE